MRPKLNVLLIEDVEDLGRSGEIVSVKSGYLRNFLLPNNLAVKADKHTLRMQEKLQKERAVKAVEERKDAEEMAKILDAMTISIKVKVDPDGQMYGSVSQLDIVNLLEKEGIKISKKAVQLKKHIKEVGTIDVPLKLKEDVITKITLNVIGEGMRKEEIKKIKEKAEEEDLLAKELKEDEDEDEKDKE